MLRLKAKGLKQKEVDAHWDINKTMKFISILIKSVSYKSEVIIETDIDNAKMTIDSIYDNIQNLSYKNFNLSLHGNFDSDIIEV